MSGVSLPTKLKKMRAKLRKRKKNTGVKVRMGKGPKEYKGVKFPNISHLGHY